MPKRILVISQHYWPENFRITDICKGFIDSEIEVDVLCGLPNYPKGEWFDGYSYTGPRYEKHNGVEIFRTIEIKRLGNTGIRIFLNYVSYPFFALIDLFRLHSRRYDAVFCYNTSPVLMMFPAIVYSKLRKTPLTTYVLDLWPENLYSVLPIQNKFLQNIAKNVSHWLYRRSDKLISLSESMQEKLMAVAPKAAHTVIPQYCEDFYFNDVYESEIKNIFKGEFNVLFAGNFSPAQDLGLLVQCALRLKNDEITNIHFVLVGDGMSRESLEVEINNYDISSYFTFTGQQPVTSIPAYQTAADALFGALSKSEDLGLTVPAKITSYLASGKPCLVAIDGVGAEVVKAANAGLTCGAGDINALYNNLLTLENMQKEDRLKMGENGREYCKKHFDRTTLLKELENFILY